MGWRKKGAWMAVLLLALLGSVVSAQQSPEKVPVWRLVDNTWQTLPSQNDYATCERIEPYSYYCNAGKDIPVKVVCKVDCFKQFSKTAEIADGFENVIQLNEDGTFTVLHLYTPAEWVVTITVPNNTHIPMEDVMIYDRFGGEFGVELISNTHGGVNFNHSGNTEKVHLVWNIGTLDPGEVAELKLRVYTDINPGGIQEFSSAHEDDPVRLNSGAVLKYTQEGKKFSEDTASILVYAIDNPGIHNAENADPTCTISFSASSFHWYVRKPGIFAAGPIEIDFTSDGEMRVGLQFSGFDDLVSSDKAATIATYYGFGRYGEEPDFNDVTSWIPAKELNDETSWSVEVSPDTTGTWSMWCKIVVDTGDPASEYSGGGTITFVAQP